jgi:hypothetical protein
MELIDPPSHESYDVPARSYRVTFWQKQVPPPDVAYDPEHMGWSAVHYDFGDAEDVHEVIEWAEAHFDANTSPESERGYVVGLWTPDGLLAHPALIQLAGHDPGIAEETRNLRWRPRHEA